MKRSFMLYAMFFVVSGCLVFSFSPALAQKKAQEPLEIKLEGAKMAPVKFSHATHTEKAKVDCVTCHHKDKDPKQPAGCVTCHPVKDPKDNAPAAKDAYHKMCQDCHKKGQKGPAKCNECHKK